MNSFNIIVIGAGPSGMMAAWRAAELTDRVLLFEKNASFARKLGLTGKGRSNVTNDASLDEFLKKFGANGVFLRNVFSKFFVSDLVSFFETRGLNLKTERQGRIFPSTDKASSVIDVFQKAIMRSGADVRLSSPVKFVRPATHGLKFVRLANGDEFLAKRVIIATGGATYPETGSTGDGFRMAKDAGHRIQPLLPGLVPLETEELFVKELQGLTLKNVKIVFTAGGKRIESGVGELLFTHFGVSGPLVLDLSGEVCYLAQEKGLVHLAIDLKPGLHDKALDAKLQAVFQRPGSGLLKNCMAELLPKRLVVIALMLARVDGNKKSHQVTVVERKYLIDVLKRFPLTIKRPRPLSEAMVTQGGLVLKEINPKTMESKIAPGIYFCGEVLDLAASSGGFNLQAAFSTGYVAGESAAMSLLKE